MVPTDAATHGRSSSRTPEPPLVEGTDIRAAIEYYARRGWTDGLPVVPTTESYLREFLAHTTRKPDDVLMSMPHLDRHCTVRLAAINAAMAGCLPEYFPVVVAAWEAFAIEGYPPKGIWQSTTGTAPFLVVNGPIRTRIGMNAAGNVFGSGVRANATIGRAIRLTAINAFGLRPGQLDQATQGTPAKYTMCVAEHEEASPWSPLHTDLGFDVSDSTVTAAVVRSAIHIEARHTTDAEQLARDIANTVARTGALVHETISACVVLGPEHAGVFAKAGWRKADISQFLYDNAVVSRDVLASVGKDGVSQRTRWRLPAGHPDAIPDTASTTDQPDRVRVLNSPGAVFVVVAGANNAGVSAVIETFGPRGGSPAIVTVEDTRP
jgi:hypothetical protein